ncbi:MAG: hypothetical protein A3F10_00220 [Coxiella sp. RIFCSPHIGHO2_12_FULL_42_15]|nr:MAG: hypothetical protein A3F10_00220 [Coxiella sp. RIFCSPHIGHO2_12_FULL_42_15]
MRNKATRLSEQQDAEAPVNEEIIPLNSNNLALNHLLLVMRKLMKTSGKDKVILASSSVLALISSLIYPESAYKLSLEAGDTLPLMALKVGGTTITNGVLNLFFIMAFLYPLLMEPNLHDFDIQPQSMGHFELSVKSIAAIFAAFPLAYLSRDSFLPEATDLPMIGIQWLIYTSLQYYSAARLYDRIGNFINKLRGIVPSNSEMYSVKLLNKFEDRVNKFKFLLKSNPNYRKNPTLQIMLEHLSPARQALKNNPNLNSEVARVHMANIIALLLQSNEIARITTTQSLPGRWYITLMTLLAQLTASSTVLAYTYATQQGLTDAWGDPALAWGFTVPAMGIFAYLILQFVKTIVTSIATTGYRMGIDPNKPWSGSENAPTCLQFLGRHCFPHAMYNLPVFSMLSLAALYFLGCFSWATSVYLTEKAAENMFHFMRPIELWLGMAMFVTTAFNTFAAPIVDNGMASSLLRSHYADTDSGQFQLLIDTFDAWLKDLKEAGPDNALYLLAELLGIQHLSADEKMEEAIQKISDTPKKLISQLVSDSNGNEVSDQYQEAALYLNVNERSALAAIVNAKQIEYHERSCWNFFSLRRNETHVRQPFINPRLSPSSS